MDQETRERLERLEGKLDKVIAFTERAERLLAAFTSGGKGKLLSVLAAARGGGR